MSNTTTSSGGIGFGGLLTIVFITLKLTNFIDWSWWWVLSPLWIGIALLFVFFIIIILVTIIT
jgi:ABC-type antimicrobial peptide transport system permease subunit